MKKTNKETAIIDNVEEKKEKKVRVRKEHLYFLYATSIDVNETGFLRAVEKGFPTVNGNNGLLHYNSLKEAKFAKQFFTDLNLFDDISIFSKIA